MDKINGKIKIAASVVALLIAIALVGGATFAWLSISRAPKIDKVRTLISNTSIVEIALANPKQSDDKDDLIQIYSNKDEKEVRANQVDFKSKTAISPAEVGENDIEIGQTTWGRVVTMEDNPIILQAPATYDKSKGISTVAFDDGGRTNGFESLIHGEIDENGLVYYRRKIKKGDYYVTPEGKTAVADKDGVDYAAAGGVAVWMRSNVEAQIDLLLRGTSILNADPDIPLELFAKVWMLENETEKGRKDGAKAGKLKELGAFSCTRQFDEDGKPVFVSTLASKDWNNMVPGVHYLVELICYIEGDREKNDNALTTQSMANGSEGRRIDVRFGDLDYDTLTCTPYITVTDAQTGGNPSKFGQYYTRAPKLNIGVWGEGDFDESLGAEMSYIITKDGAKYDEGTFPIAKASDSKGIVFNRDGKYEITAWLTDNIHVDKQGNKIKLYAVGFNTRYLVNLKETALVLHVDTTPPDISITEPEEGSFHNTPQVKLVMVTNEQNIKQVKIDNHVVKAKKIVTPTDEGEKITYSAERVFEKEGDYEVTVSVLDKAHTEISTTRKFVIDRTNPIIDGLKWTFVNEGALSNFLNNITAGQMFIEKIQIEARASDLHLDRFTVEPSGQSSKVSTRIESSADGKQMMAFVEIDADYDGSIRFLANDKAGNSESYETEIFTVDDLNTNAEADKDDWTKSEDGFRFSLSPDPSNRISTDHYEYSVDGGENWYSDSRTIGGVHYEIEASEDPATGKLIMGSVVNVKIDEGKSYSGKIRFRAMTTALSTGDFRIYSETSILPGAETEDLDVLLDRKNPTNPDGVSATVDGIPIEDNTYTNASEVKVFGFGGSAASGITEYAYSVNGTDYTNYPPGEGFTVIEEGITTVYVKAISKVGLASDGRKVFTVKIDRTNPEIEIEEIKEVNTGGVPQLLSNLTGQMFFTNDVDIKVRAADQNCISEIEWSTDPKDETIEGNTLATGEVKELSTIVRVPKEYKGRIGFKATDAAGNTGKVITIDSLEEDMND